MKFYNFLEHKLNEAFTTKDNFIRKFFSDFENFSHYDNQDLGVFADWLHDNNDPRYELVHLRYTVGNLNPNYECAELAEKLHIKVNIANFVGPDEWGLGKTLIYYYMKNDHYTDGRFPSFIIGIEELSGWYQYGKRIPVSRVDDRILEIYFWDLIGYGWSLK